MGGNAWGAMYSNEVAPQYVDSGLARRLQEREAVKNEMRGQPYMPTGSKAPLLPQYESLRQQYLQQFDMEKRQRLDHQLQERLRQLDNEMRGGPSKVPILEYGKPMREAIAQQGPWQSIAYPTA